MTAVQQRTTLEEFLQLPEEKPALEFEDGVVIQKVSPKARHSVLQLAMCDLVNQFTVPRKMARAFPELRASYGGHSYVPDVSVYRWERIPRNPDGRIEDDFIEPPDIAVEIVSPGQSANALLRRCLWYVEHGVLIALLIDPADDSVLHFSGDTLPVALQGSNRIDLDAVLPGLTLTVDRLFASLKVD